MKKIILMSMMIFSFNEAYGQDWLAVEGRITDVSGIVPVESSQIRFKLEVLSPDDDTCVIYEETHPKGGGTMDMSGTLGYFTLKLGRGDQVSTDDFDTAMDNGNNSLGGGCYDPTGSVNKTRTLRISYTDFDGSGNEVVLSQNIDIAYSAWAKQAADSAQLGGMGPGQFIQDSGSGTQANLATLVDGNSTAYTPASVGTPSTGSDAVNKTYADDNIAGSPADKTDIGSANSNDVLTWNGSAWVASPQAAAAGDIEAVSAGTGLTGGGTAGSVTIDIDDGGVNSLQLANNAVTEAKINNGAVTAAKLATDSVTAAKIASNAVGNSEISDGSILLADLNSATVSNFVAASNGTASGLTANGLTTLNDDLVMANNKAIRLLEATGNGNEFISIQAPGALSSGYALTLPADDGNAGEVLSTDGSGTLSWEPNGGGGEANTASNLGAGLGLFSNKSTLDLQFKSISAGSTAVSLTDSSSAITIDLNVANINHDSLSGFVANEHIDHSSVSITAGAGLTGGGDITTTRTIAVGAGPGIAVSANDIAVDIAGETAELSVDSSDEILIYDTSVTALKKMSRANFVLSEAEVDTMVNNNGFITSAALTGLATSANSMLLNGTQPMTGNLSLANNKISNDGGAGEGLLFETNGDARFLQDVRLDGSLGIGINNPTHKLHIEGNSLQSFTYSGS
ncbi:MAG: hypothetical protein MJK18_15710, partial [Bdellovibrionales bacterium]|nr:hypothetical protein [Bdellovibrionales bacterium]